MKAETYGWLIGAILGGILFFYVFFNWITTSHWLIDAYLISMYIGNLFWNLADHIKKHY